MKEKKSYVCTSCGSGYSKWQGQCTECKEWNTVEEKIVSKTTVRGKTSHREGAKARKVNTVTQDTNVRIITGINEFDRVMGGGIVPDSITILSSVPGGGKTSLTGHILNRLAKQGYKTLYASGEESESQLKNRLDRIEGDISDNFWLISTNSMDDVVQNIKEVDADIVVIDSIQTMVLNEYLPSRSGTPSQTMGCMDVVMQLAKNPERKRAVFIISQLNKNEELAGLRALEHAVDTVLHIQSENSEELRALVATKNRFGAIGEMGFFKMTEKGMESVDNPSEYFTVHREQGEEVSGCAITSVREGTRPIVLEIESLVSMSYTSFPTRITESFSKDALNTLVSVLEQRATINLSDKNVVVKAMGTGKLKDSGANLAVVMSIVSSLINRSTPNQVAFIGDIGLTGELKRVPAMEIRIRELARMGFKKVYVARNSVPQGIEFSGIDVIQVRTLQEVISNVFGQLRR